MNKLIMFYLSLLFPFFLLAQNGLDKKIDQYLSTMNESGLFSGSVLVAKADRIIFQKGYGMASLQFDIPNSKTTRFDLASIGKTFVSTLIMKLHQDGKLNIKDPICNYVDDCPGAWSGVTIFHLLTHTSGIMNYTELPDQYEMRSVPTFMAQALERIEKMPLKFTPGTKWEYSNTGYKLLVKIIEKAAKMSFEDYITKTIFEPLQMNHSGTFFRTGIRKPIIRGLASGYTDGIGPLENAPWVDAAYGGGIYSTTDDMFKYGRSFFSESILSKTTRDSVFKSFLNNYGLGWFIIKSKTDTFYMHGGGAPGFALTFTVYPKEQIIIFIASNLDTSPSDKINNDIFSLLHSQKVQNPPKWKEIPADTSNYSSFAGRYQNTKQKNFIITVTTENGKLWNRLGDDPGATTMVLRPLSPNKFFNKTFVLYDIEFLWSKDNKIAGVVLNAPWGRDEFIRIE